MCCICLRETLVVRMRTSARTYTLEHIYLISLPASKRRRVPVHHFFVAKLCTFSLALCVFRIFSLFQRYEHTQDATSDVLKMIFFKFSLFFFLLHFSAKEMQNEKKKGFQPFLYLRHIARRYVSLFSHSYTHMAYFGVCSSLNVCVYARRCHTDEKHPAKRISIIIKKPKTTERGHRAAVRKKKNISFVDVWMWCVHNEIWFMIEEFFQVENWFSEIYRWIYIHSHSFVVFTQKILLLFSSVWWCGGGVVLDVVLLWLWCGFFSSFLIADCFEWLNWSHSGFDAMIFVIFFVALFHSEHQIDHLCIFLTMSLSVTWTQKWTTSTKKRRNEIHLPIVVFFLAFIKIWKCERVCNTVVQSEKKSKYANRRRRLNADRKKSG